MRWYLFFGMWLPGSLMWGQATLVLSGKLTSPRMDIGPYTTFYEYVSGDTLSLSLIRTKVFMPFAQKKNELASFADRSVMMTWLRFRNKHPADTLHALHKTGVHEFITLYENDHLIGQTGEDHLHSEFGIGA